MSYRFEQMTASDAVINDVQKLLHLSFPNRTEKFSSEYLCWQYRDNPNGGVIAFNAYAEDGTMAAHYATIPIKMKVGKDIMRGLLSLNTATHPDHRGKKLFTLLAEKTYSYAQSLGYKFVLGVANANSTHGFLNHLGFYMITPLNVQIGVGDIFKKTNIDVLNRVVYDKDTVLWRLKCPGRKYSKLRGTIYGNINVPLFHTVVAKAPDGLDEIWPELPKTVDIFNLYIGIGVKHAGCYMNLPHFIKRSPFNLIFKDLTGGDLPILTKSNSFIQLFDFDVA